MRKRRSLLAALIIVLAFSSGAIARTVFDVIMAEVRTDFVVEIDGEVRKFRNVDGERVYPILHDGTTYLPVRAIGEIMGKDVYWYEADKRIELRDKKNTPTVTDADVIVEDDKKPKDKKDNPAQFSAKDVIGKEQAKKIALEKAKLKENEVSFIKIELDKDNGIWKYEVEFRKGLKEYSAEIKADDGKILDWEADFDD